MSDSRVVGRSGLTDVVLALIVWAMAGLKTSGAYLRGAVVLPPPSASGLPPGFHFGRHVVLASHSIGPTMDAIASLI
jgi:hypothetical protein